MEVFVEKVQGKKNYERGFACSWIQIPIWRHFVCSLEAYLQLSYFEHMLEMDMGAHTRCRKMDIVLQTFTCLFVPDQKHFLRNSFNWYIVLDIDRKLFVICKQNDENSAVYETRGLYRSLMMNASALKWNIPMTCETKFNMGMTWTVTFVISVSVSARLRTSLISDASQISFQKHDLNFKTSKPKTSPLYFAAQVCLAIPILMCRDSQTDGRVTMIPVTPSCWIGGALPTQPWSRWSTI